MPYARGWTRASRVVTPSWSDPIEVDGSAMIASTSASAISDTIIIVAPRSAAIVSSASVNGSMSRSAAARATVLPSSHRSDGSTTAAIRIPSQPPVATM